MAFDRPLEADRVDELSLLSSFVSAPIVGPLLWMLGGHAAAKTQQKKLNAETISSQVEGTQHSCPLTDARSSPVPNADGSDVSDEGDYTMDENDDAMVNAGSTFRKSRKMSWSDESGQNLVEYCDESSHNSHTSSMSQTSKSQAMQPKIAKPMKSAIRNRKVCNSKSKYVPNMSLPSEGNVTTGTNGINTNGYISPQYGWYVSTTPPTPEHFSQSKSVTKSSSRQQESPPFPTNFSTSTQKQTKVGTTRGNGHTRCPIPNNKKMGPKRLITKRPVFTKGVPNSMGWPSVPM